MTMPGAPCIYYGDEIGMTGASEPFSRAAFPWHDESQWDRPLLSFYQRATVLRRDHAVLRTGDFHIVHADDGVFAFQRRLGATTAVVVFNRNTDARTVAVNLHEPEAGHAFHGIWNGAPAQVSAGQLPAVTVPAHDAVVLVSD